MSEICTLYPYQNLKYRELLAYVQTAQGAGQMVNVRVRLGWG